VDSISLFLEPPGQAREIAVGLKRLGGGDKQWQETGFCLLSSCFVRESTRQMKIEPMGLRGFDSGMISDLSTDSADQFPQDIMSELFMVLGFALAAYSIVANDSIQTLGTFLCSNAKRPWWILWLWISGIMVVTVLWGWYANSGDPAFGRLNQKGIALPETFSWLYVVPPLILVALTRAGIPVSTSLLVLTAFAGLSALQGGGAEQSGDVSGVFMKIMRKSVVGYVVALGIGLLAYGLFIAFQK